MKSIKMEGLNMEQESMLANIFAQFDNFKASGIMKEPVFDLMDVNLNDQRIQSLIRTKDAEILKLRDKIFSIEKSRSISTNSESQNEIIRVLQGENLKLKNEMIALRTEKGSAELMNDYKIQIKSLNDQILRLEQEKSDLAAEMYNMKKEF